MIGSVVVKDLAHEGVRLIAPDDPQFDELARPLIGSRAARVLQLKPMLAILENTAPRTVVAMSLTWRFNNRIGTRVERTNSVFPNVVCGDQLIARRRPGVRPGERHVIATRCVVEGLDGIGEDDRWIEDFAGQSRQMSRGAGEIVIELDAVIFDDGALIGPNHDGWLSELFGTYVAEKQRWYRAIITALDAGKSVEDAYEPIRAFQEDIRRQMTGGAMGPRLDMRQMIWKVQAASESSLWRSRYADAEIPSLLNAIRLQPFVITSAPPTPPSTR